MSEQTKKAPKSQGSEPTSETSWELAALSMVAKSPPIEGNTEACAQPQDFIEEDQAGNDAQNEVVSSSQLIVLKAQLRAARNDAAHLKSKLDGETAQIRLKATQQTAENREQSSKEISRIRHQIAEENARIRLAAHAETVRIRQEADAEIARIRKEHIAETTRILAQATKEATDIREQAAKEADLIRAEGLKENASIREQASKEAASIREQAYKEVAFQMNEKNTLLEDLEAANETHVKEKRALQEGQEQLKEEKVALHRRIIRLEQQMQLLQSDGNTPGEKTSQTKAGEKEAESAQEESKNAKPAANKSFADNLRAGLAKKNPPAAEKKEPAAAQKKEPQEEKKVEGGFVDPYPQYPHRCLPCGFYCMKPHQIEEHKRSQVHTFKVLGLERDDLPAGPNNKVVHYCLECMIRFEGGRVDFMIHAKLVHRGVDFNKLPQEHQLKSIKATNLLSEAMYGQMLAQGAADFATQECEYKNCTQVVRSQKELMLHAALKHYITAPCARCQVVIQLTNMTVHLKLNHCQYFR